MKRRVKIFTLGVMLSAALFAAPAQAQLFGPSDDEIAKEKAQDDQIAQLTQQLSDLQAQDRDRFQQLEDKVQSLTQSLAQSTGANEELNHQISLLKDRLDSQQKDFSYRLCMLSAQQLGAGDQGLNCAAAGTASAPVQNGALPPLTGAVPLQPQGRPPGTLGTLPSGAPPPAAGGDTTQFDTAMNLLGKAQYTEASAAFRAYADANPDDQDLSPQAIYWVGQIAYIQHNYSTAVSTFAEQIKKYPTSVHSPDSMLRLGQSLLAEGQTSGGCTTLAALKTRYPKAPAATLAEAAGARKASCGK